MKPCSNHSIPIINQIRSLASSPLFIYYKRTCILSLLISRIFQSKQTIEHIEQNAIKQNFHGNVRTCSFAKIFVFLLYQTPFLHSVLLDTHLSLVMLQNVTNSVYIQDVNFISSFVLHKLQTFLYSP